MEVPNSETQGWHPLLSHANACQNQSTAGLGRATDIPPPSTAYGKRMTDLDHQRKVAMVIGVMGFGTESSSAVYERLMTRARTDDRQFKLIKSFPGHLIKV